jgi:hypothetical protein
MGHKYLGGNTMLFVVEGLFGGSESEVKPPRKWNMNPFNGHWSSSIFMSIDQVALESVCYDFLRTEFNGENQPENYPNWVGVDDYLHQAASNENWPEGIAYNPDGTGNLKSLGVHEHWNNADEKQYSRNLGFEKGIELKKISGKIVSTPVLSIPDFTFHSYPNPFSDELMVSFVMAEPGSINLEIFTLNGKLVRTINSDYFTEGRHELRLNTSFENLLPGTYILSLSGQTNKGKFRETQKIIKTK